MNTTIRLMAKKDTATVKEMMRAFYASPAVHTNGSEQIFDNDLLNCVNDCPYLEGYVFEAQNTIVGYAMLAKSFSTEFGKPCIWIEDLYLAPDHRGQGLAGKFFDLIHKKYPNHVFRLEVEEENVYAVKAYKKNGYDTLPYVEMIKQ